jgi:hypothetical protein
MREKENGAAIRAAAARVERRVCAARAAARAVCDAAGARPRRAAPAARGPARPQRRGARSAALLRTEPRSFRRTHVTLPPPPRAPRRAPRRGRNTRTQHIHATQRNALCARGGAARRRPALPFRGVSPFRVAPIFATARPAPSSSCPASALVLLAAPRHGGRRPLPLRRGGQRRSRFERVRHGARVTRVHVRLCVFGVVCQPRRCQRARLSQPRLRARHKRGGQQRLQASHWCGGRGGAAERRLRARRMRACVCVCVQGGAGVACGARGAAARARGARPRRRRSARADLLARRVRKNCANALTIF